LSIRSAWADVWSVHARASYAYQLDAFAAAVLRGRTGEDAARRLSGEHDRHRCDLSRCRPPTP
jgi:hypothetical protein